MFDGLGLPLELGSLLTKGVGVLETASIGWDALEGVGEILGESTLSFPPAGSS